MRARQISLALAFVLFLVLVLNLGCGRSITAPETDSAVCSKTDTLWVVDGRTYTITYFASGANCTRLGYDQHRR